MKYAIVFVLAAAACLAFAQAQAPEAADSGVEPKACDNVACVNACLRAGWRGGFCQNGQCYCWKGRDMEESVVEPLEKILSHEAQSGVEPRACDNVACVNACLRAGWRGGFCQNGQCWCWRGRNMEITVLLENIKNEEAAQSGVEPKACDNVACVNACLAAGWRGGFCQNGQCWCWRGRNMEVREQLEKIQEEATRSGVEPKACDNVACVNACLRAGWRGGFCQNGQCYCWKGRNMEVTELLEKINEDALL